MIRALLLKHQAMVFVLQDFFKVLVDRSRPSEAHRITEFEKEAKDILGSQIIESLIRQRCLRFDDIANSLES